MNKIGFLTFAATLLLSGGCAHDETALARQIQSTLYPATETASFLNAQTEILARKKFRFGEHAEFGGLSADLFPWGKRDALAVSGIWFLPAESGCHTYRYRAITTQQAHLGEELMLILTGALPSDDSPPVLEIYPAARADPAARLPLPPPETLAKWQARLMRDIAAGTIRWRDLTEIKGEYSDWYEDRFHAVRSSGAISPDDFTLTGIASLPEGGARFTFAFAPLLVNAGNRGYHITSVNFDLDRAGKTAEIFMHTSMMFPVACVLLPLIPAADCNAMSLAVLHKLFELPLPDNLRRRERFRICLPVDGADADFVDRLNPDAPIPELPPFRYDSRVPGQFRKDHWVSLADSVFNYRAGQVMPVTNHEAWVYFADIQYLRHLKPGEIALDIPPGAPRVTAAVFSYRVKLKKGLFGWKVTAVKPLVSSFPRTAEKKAPKKSAKAENNNVPPAKH